jgi:hypothetical protein
MNFTLIRANKQTARSFNSFSGLLLAIAVVAIVLLCLIDNSTLRVYLMNYDNKLSVI